MKLQGSVAAFDNFSLQLRRGGTTQLVYKHAISTIAPLEWPEGFDGTPKPEGEGNDLQSSFLAGASDKGERMTMFLMNGVMLEGQVADFDQYCLILRRGSQGQLIYKHAISTMQPNERGEGEPTRSTAEEHVA